MSIMTYLVTSTDVLILTANVNTLGDIWRLLLDGDENVASLVIET